MVFCFSFFTYNFQRFVKFRSTTVDTSEPGSRLQWITKKKSPLMVLSLLSGIIGLGCTYFLNPFCFLILIPMGALSTFYVIPIIPFYKKSPSLREIPYLKIIVIGLVWSLIIIALPTLETSDFIAINPKYFIGILQVFLYTIAITLPFDIRDIDYDKNNDLKTIPRLLGVTKTIILSELLLIGSLFLTYNSDLTIEHSIALMVGYIITMIVIAFSKKERPELFFAGLVEGMVLILYISVLISEYYFSL
jgi:4-hydroxybenzoate polyprenyltransferase